MWRAKKWAQGRKLQPDKTIAPVTVYKIDTAKLPSDVRLFETKSLKRLFDYGFAEDEVLFFGRIPREAAVEVFDSE